jgi:hypothetical protein
LIEEWGAVFDFGDATRMDRMISASITKILDDLAVRTVRSICL